MKGSRKNLIRHLRDILIVTLVGTLVSLLFILDAMTWHNVLVNLGYCAVLGTVIWKGNELMAYWIDRKYPWLKNPGKTLWINISATIILSVVLILLVNYGWFNLVYKISFGQFFLHRGGYWLVVIQLLVTFIITLILYVGDFFHAWKESVKREEQFKRESLAFQYESLKNQVNPHFLFNSLNVLSSLVMKDQEGSVQFIRQLSEVYRYVLEQKDKEVVELGTEMKFVESYIYLQQIRYAENLHVELAPDLPHYYSQQVIPISVQMLVENAIKHNIISGDEPLTVRIAVEQDHLVVRNNLQVRSTIPESGNIGLNNIRSRYEYLTEKEFITVNDGKEFVVRMPLIRMHPAPTLP
ncbi:MAG TPA: histidine kinase [Bacteroidales bacterium]|nr:histidine kinase [Bacteroidales bacterium]HRZ20822.1 histidine kinase [Bacteroidales bacterium]